MLFECYLARKKTAIVYQKKLCNFWWQGQSPRSFFLNLKISKVVMLPFEIWDNDIKIFVILNKLGIIIFEFLDLFVQPDKATETFDTKLAHSGEFYCILVLGQKRSQSYF